MKIYLNTHDIRSKKNFKIHYNNTYLNTNTNSHFNTDNL